MNGVRIWILISFFLLFGVLAPFLHAEEKTADAVMQELLETRLGMTWEEFVRAYPDTNFLGFDGSDRGLDPKKPEKMLRRKLPEKQGTFVYVFVEGKLEAVTWAVPGQEEMPAILEQLRKISAADPTFKSHAGSPEKQLFSHKKDGQIVLLWVVKRQSGVILVKKFAEPGEIP